MLEEVTYSNVQLFFLMEGALCLFKSKIKKYKDNNSSHLRLSHYSGTCMIQDSNRNWDSAFLELYSDF